MFTISEKNSLFQRHHDTILYMVNVTHTFNDFQLQALMQRIDDIRDKTLIFLIAKTGLYVDELRSLCIQHVDFSTHCLTVIGKRARTITICDETLSYLNAWLHVRPGAAHDVLFTSLIGDYSPLSQRGIDNILRKWGAHVGIDLNYRILKHCFKDAQFSSVPEPKPFPMKKLGAILVIATSICKLASIFAPCSDSECS